jgi:hypothetical protein
VNRTPHGREKSFRRSHAPASPDSVGASLCRKCLTSPGRLGFIIDSSPRATRRHLTGRNHQFNAKATADTIRRFNAICDGQRWIAGLALEHLVALGDAALRDGTIAEAIDALEKSLRAKA